MVQVYLVQNAKLAMATHLICGNTWIKHKDFILALCVNILNI